MTKTIMTDMIIPMDGEICLASSNDGNAASFNLIKFCNKTKINQKVIVKSQ